MQPRRILERVEHQERGADGREPMRFLHEGLPRLESHTGRTIRRKARNQGGHAGRPRAKLVAKALEYLDSLSQEAQTDDQLKREIGETYLRIGDIQGRAGHANLGDTAGDLLATKEDGKRWHGDG